MVSPLDTAEKTANLFQYSIKLTIQAQESMI